MFSKDCRLLEDSKQTQLLQSGPVERSGRWGGTALVAHNLPSRCNGYQFIKKSKLVLLFPLLQNVGPSAVPVLIRRRILAAENSMQQVQRFFSHILKI